MNKPTKGGHSSVVECPPINWKFGWSIRGHWMNHRIASFVMNFHLHLPRRSKFQALACR